MSKILVSVNEGGFNSALTEIKGISDNVERLNDFIQEYLGHPLSPEIFIDVVNNKGRKTKEFYRQAIQKDIARLKITSPTTKRQMLAGADEFEILINEFYELLRRSNQYASYVTIEKGKAVLTDEEKNRLHETFKNYAETPEQIAVYEAQKEACAALNKLHSLVSSTSDISFALPIFFYSSFFALQNNVFTANPVQFSFFNKKTL
jgi:hypothetical protein